MPFELVLGLWFAGLVFGAIGIVTLALKLRYEHELKRRKNAPSSVRKPDDTDIIQR